MSHSIVAKSHVSKYNDTQFFFCISSLDLEFSSYLSGGDRGARISLDHRQLRLSLCQSGTSGRTRSSRHHRLQQGQDLDMESVLVAGGGKDVTILPISRIHWAGREDFHRHEGPRAEWTVCKV